MSSPSENTETNNTQSKHEAKKEKKCHKWGHNYKCAGIAKGFVGGGILGTATAFALHHTGKAINYIHYS